MLACSIWHGVLGMVYLAWFMRCQYIIPLTAFLVQLRKVMKWWDGLAQIPSWTEGCAPFLHTGKRQLRPYYIRHQHENSLWCICYLQLSQTHTHTQRWNTHTNWSHVQSNSPNTILLSAEWTQSAHSSWQSVNTGHLLTPSSCFSSVHESALTCVSTK